MRPEAERLREQALLVRAAEQEARRQAARQRGDTDTERAAENELRELWRAHADLEGIA
jgi:hypothetical protein